MAPLLQDSDASDDNDGDAVSDVPSSLEEDDAGQEEESESLGFEDMDSGVESDEQSGSDEEIPTLIDRSSSAVPASLNGGASMASSGSLILAS